MRCGCNQKKGVGGVLGVIGRKVGGKMRGSKSRRKRRGGGGGGGRRRRGGGEEERGGGWVDEGR